MKAAKYKLKCDKCPTKVGDTDKDGRKIPFFSYVHYKTKKSHGRCLKHLKLK